MEAKERESPPAGPAVPVSSSASALSSAEITRHLEALLDGNRGSAAWLYDTYSTGLYRRLRGRYGYPGGFDTDDILQDSFVFFFQNRGKVLRDFLERTPLPGRTAKRLERHLWDLACGLVSNRRRAAAVRKHTYSLDEQSREQQSPTVNTEHELVQRDRLEKLDQCLQGRGTRVALYYKLRFWDGHSPSEIVGLTGWSKKATYKLKQALNEAVEACAERLNLV